MDLENIREIRKIALIGLFSNDILLERIVFKGGSALELVYALSSRSSIDIDFSIENDFVGSELQEIETLFKESLSHKFKESGYLLFDFVFTHRPKFLRADAPPFWGGYNIDFKVISSTAAKTLAFDIQQMRRQSSIATLSQGKTFRIEISKHEYCKEKTYGEIDGYKISVYTLRAIMFEKFRAICQQMKEYPYTKTASPRPRDFYDIQKIMVVEEFDKTLSPEDLLIIKAIFTQKAVPLSLLELIDKYKDFHQQDLASLLDTLSPSEQKAFNFDTCYTQVVALGRRIFEMESAR